MFWSLEALDAAAVEPVSIDAAEAIVYTNYLI
jgi:hypothetical protein